MNALSRLRHAPPQSQGFTLLELLVVLLIIALLAGYVGPKMFDRLELAKVQTAKGQMKSLADAMGQYRLDNGHFPTEEQGLKALVEHPPTEPGWHGPYLAKVIPLDPWNKPFFFKNPGAAHEVEIISLGRDGKAAGEGTDADVVYGF